MPLPHLKSSLLPSGATPDPPEPSRWDKEGWDKAEFGGDFNDEITVHLVTTEVVHSCTMIQRSVAPIIGSVIGLTMYWPDFMYIGIGSD